MCVGQTLCSMSHRVSHKARIEELPEGEVGMCWQRRTRPCCGRASLTEPLEGMFRVPRSPPNVQAMCCRSRRHRLQAECSGKQRGPTAGRFLAPPWWQFKPPSGLLISGGDSSGTPGAGWGGEVAPTPRFPGLSPPPYFLLPDLGSDGLSP